MQVFLLPIYLSSLSSCPCLEVQKVAAQQGIYRSTVARLFQSFPAQEADNFEEKIRPLLKYCVKSTFQAKFY
jgi:hypothetical protein